MLRYGTSVVNLGVLPHVAHGAMLAGIVALIGTIDIVLGSVDRERRGARGQGADGRRP